MKGTVVNRSRAGWAVQWHHNGFESAMPDQETARVCAASRELLAVAEKVQAFLNDLAKSNPGYLSKLVLQDYQRYNEMLIELPRAIDRAKPSV